MNSVVATSCSSRPQTQTQAGEVESNLMFLFPISDAITVGKASSATSVSLILVALTEPAKSRTSATVTQIGEDFSVTKVCISS